jgi:hypothetical protein
VSRLWRRESQLAFKHNGIKCLPLKIFWNFFKITSTSCGTSPGLYLIGGLAALKSTIFLTGIQCLLLPLLQYSTSVGSWLENMPQGFESVLYRNLDHGGHPVRGIARADVGSGLLSRESDPRGVNSGENACH